MQQSFKKGSVFSEHVLYKAGDVAATISLHVNSRKIKLIALNTTGPVKISGGNDVQVNVFTHLGNKVRSTEADIDAKIGSGWNPRSNPYKI